MVNFCKSPLSLSMNITCSFFYQIKNFFHLWISQEDNYKKNLNMKKNGIMYEEPKLKKVIWIFKSLICAWITSLHFQWTYLSHFIIKLRFFYSIGCAKRRITNLFGMLKVMEQCIMNLNSKTQTELLCLVYANQPLHFQRA